MKNIPSTQFKNMSAAKWIKDSYFYITWYNEVNISSNGYFLELDNNCNLVIYDSDGEHARLKLSERLRNKMLELEEEACERQYRLNEELSFNCR